MAKKDPAARLKKTLTRATTKGATAYSTEWIHDVEAGKVQAIVDDRRKRKNYISHDILPEDDGEFTLMFIYLA